MIVGAIAGAILALIGAGVGWLLTRLVQSEDPPKWPIALCAALAIAVGQPLIRAWAQDTPESVLAEMEERAPYIAAIRTKHPEEYAQLRDVVADAFRTRNASAARTRVRAIVVRLVLSRVPTTSTETLEKFARMTVAQGRFIEERYPHYCNEWLLGQDFGFDRLASPEMVASETALYSEVLNGPTVPVVSPMTETEIGDAMLPAVTRIAKNHSITIEQAVDAMMQKGPEKLQCQVSTELFSEILAMPPAKKERLLRSMLTGI